VDTPASCASAGAEKAAMRAAAANTILVLLVMAKSPTISLHSKGVRHAARALIGVDVGHDYPPIIKRTILWEREISSTSQGWPLSLIGNM
jgi:hypothetical protein